MNYPVRAEDLFSQADRREYRLCLPLNRVGHRRYVRRLFSMVSRLGDGVFWYSLMAIFALTDGVTGIQAAVHMGTVGTIGLVIYKYLKRKLRRRRPYVTHAGIVQHMPPLDVCSFPSGHTLHAVSFTWVALHYYPALALLLIPFALLVALSRVVLGLHYPSDVLVGAMIGATLAIASFQFI